MPLTAPPIAPTPSDTPEVFDAKIYARMVWDSVNVTELNALQSDVTAKQATASDAAGEAIAQVVIAQSKVGLAETQASNAAISAGQSAESAVIAADKVITATTLAGNSAASATLAEASRIAASKLNLGAKSSAPTLDNQGASLLTGATYYDTTLAKWRVWTGATWDNGITAISGVATVNGLDGAVVLKTVGGFSLAGAGDIPVGLTVVPISTTSQAIVAGNSYTIENVAATALTAPASASAGDIFEFSVCNNLLTNTINWNGLKVNGATATTDTIDINTKFNCQYINATYGWKVS